jgi:hypothetical protein
MRKENGLVLTTVVIVMLFLLATPVSAKKTGPYSFVSKLMRQNSKTIGKIADEIPTNAVIKKTDISTIKKSLPDIEVKRLNPDVLKLASVGGEIAKTSNFANKFINNSPDPANIISQYTRYGKPYLKTAQKFSKTVVSHAASLNKLSTKQLSKFGNLSKETIVKFKNEDFAKSAFVSVLKRTGKIGYETMKRITQMVNKYPKSSVVAGLLIWFSTDPESFLDSVKDVGAYASSFATQTTSALAEGVGEGIIKNLKTTLGDSTKQIYVFIGGIFLMITALLSLRITRRLIFFPFRILGSKLNSYMDHKEANIAKQNPFYKFDKEEHKTKPVLSRTSIEKGRDREAKGLF